MNGLTFKHIYQNFYENMKRVMFNTYFVESMKNLRFTYNRLILYTLKKIYINILEDKTVL